MSVFVVKADEKRGGQSIRQFCRNLGINHSLWSRILRGQRTPSADVINALLALYPELGHWLVEDAKSRKVAGTASNPHHATPGEAGPASGAADVLSGLETAGEPVRGSGSETEEPAA